MANPLVPGSSYRITAPVRIGRCEFQAGEVVTYTSGGYSPYDDCFIYHFVDSFGVKRICTSPTEWTEEQRGSFEARID